MRRVKFVDLGLISFEEALDRQSLMVESIAEGTDSETVHLLEHPPVFTIGRTGSMENLISPCDAEGRPITVKRINRGGDVTFHGPGQLVGYPHLDLRKRGRDVHRYLRNLEECLIQAVSLFGVKAFRREGLTGVWTEEGKLASIGVGVRRWVTMHGFALNVTTDLKYFRLIHPCGIPDCPVTSLAELVEDEVTVETLKQVLPDIFGEVFEPAAPN